jgi:hypothetical protein
MLPAFLSLAAVLAAAFALIAPRVSRRLRRVRQATGTAVVPPVRPQAARGMAVPVQPPAEERKPFTFGGCVTIEAHDEEES